MNPDRFADMVCILSGGPAWSPPTLPGHTHITPDSHGDAGLPAFVTTELHTLAWRQLAIEVGAT